MNVDLFRNLRHRSSVPQIQIILIVGHLSSVPQLELLHIVQQNVALQFEQFRNRGIRDYICIL